MFLYDQQLFYRFGLFLKHPVCTMYVPFHISSIHLQASIVLIKSRFLHPAMLRRLCLADFYTSMSHLRSTFWQDFRRNTSHFTAFFDQSLVIWTRVYVWRHPWKFPKVFICFLCSRKTSGTITAWSVYISSWNHHWQRLWLEQALT